jgi:hypothetical protein
MAIIRTEQQFVKFLGSSPNKVAQSGFTNEEFAISKGRADPDSRLNPMADAKVIDIINPNPRKASDRARLHEPVAQHQGAAAAQEQVRLTHFFVRSALKRARGRLNEFVRRSFSQRREKLGEQRSKQMEASFARIDRMADTLQEYDEMAASVLNRVLSHQKG